MKVGERRPTLLGLSFKFRGEDGSLYRALVLAWRRSNNLLRLGGFPTADGQDSLSSGTLSSNLFNRNSLGKKDIHEA